MLVCSVVFMLGELVALVKVSNYGDYFVHMQRDKSRGTALFKSGWLYEGLFPQDGGYSVSMKVGVFIITSLYNDGFICCRIEIGLCGLEGLWKKGTCWLFIR